MGCARDRGCSSFIGPGHVQLCHIVVMRNDRGACDLLFCRQRILYGSKCVSKPPITSPSRTWHFSTQNSCDARVSSTAACSCSPRVARPFVAPCAWSRSRAFLGDAVARSKIKKAYRIVCRLPRFWLSPQDAAGRISEFAVRRLCRRRPRYLRRQWESPGIGPQFYCGAMGYRPGG